MADVAVVIPAFRAEDVLGATLASVAGQSLAAAEVVVVDDASPDRTADVARGWRAQLPLTVIAAETNGGPAAARRAGIAASHSPLVALLDADDVLLPDHLASLVDAGAAPGTIATADGLRWQPGRGLRGRTHRRHFPVPPADEQRHAILRANFVFIGSMFARDDYERAGGFRDGFSGAEDWDLWIRMLRNGARVVASHGATYVYRLSPTGLTAGRTIMATYVKVLEAAVREATDETDRAVAEASLRRYRARRHLNDAHAAARTGDPGGARTAARAALSGSRRVALEAAGLLVAPRPVTAVADALRRRYW